VCSSRNRYPETDWALYAEKPAATANISAEQPTAHVVLRFGPKAGVIIGSVRDAVTGKPLNSAFRISRDQAHWISSSAPAEFRFLIPSNVPVELEVSASGYRTWRYIQAFRGSQLILRSGEEKRMDIVLGAIMTQAEEHRSFSFLRDTPAGSCWSSMSREGHPLPRKMEPEYSNSEPTAD
jgi:hypothetical protein